MVKVAGPLMSMSASGSLAKAIVFASWKGRPYVRQLVTPANPQSAAQVAVRAMFKFLSQIWDGLTANEKASWDDRADTAIVSNFNAFMGYNQDRWRNFNGPSQEDPANETGTQSSLNVWTATAGVGETTLAIRVDAPNDGWGVAFFRSTTLGFTSTRGNCIGLIDFAPGVETYFIDSPLVAGTYYYQARTFTDDGNLNVEAGERTAIVT